MNSISNIVELENMDNANEQGIDFYHSISGSAWTQFSEIFTNILPRRTVCPGKQVVRCSVLRMFLCLWLFPSVPVIIYASFVDIRCSQRWCHFCVSNSLARKTWGFFFQNKTIQNCIETVLAGQGRRWIVIYVFVPTCEAKWLSDESQWIVSYFASDGW